MSIIRKALYGLGAAAIVAAIAVPAASAAQVGASVPGNYISLPGTTRVVPTPGQHLAAGQTATVQVTGTRAGQADAGALAVVVQLTSVTPTAAGSLTVFEGDDGHSTPGNPTVQYSRGQENTATTTVGLTAAGTLKITARGSATNYLLSVTGEYLPAAAAGTGPQGPKGDPGQDGKDGVVGNILHNSGPAVTVDPGTSVNVYATCATSVDGLASNGDAADYVATGGGYTFDGGRFADMTVFGTRQAITDPNVAGFVNGHGWIVQVHNNDTVSHTATAWVTCVDAPNDDPND